MDPLTILALVSQVLAVLPSAIQLGINVEGLITRTLQIVQQPAAATEADLDAAMTEIMALKAQLDADPPAAA